MPPDQDLQEPLLERSTSDSDSNSKAGSKKRKRGAKTEKHKTLSVKKAKNTKAQDEVDLDLETGLNYAFSKMNSQLLADYVAQKTRRFESELSNVELEDKYIPGMLYFQLAIF